MSKKKGHYTSSDEDFTASSTSKSFYSDDDTESSMTRTTTTEEETSSREETPSFGYASNLLSNPANRYISQSSEDDDEEDGNGFTLGCAKRESPSTSDEEEETPVVPTVFLRKPNLTHISTKMGDLAPLSSTEVALGDLEPLETPYALESLDTLSTKEFTLLAPHSIPNETTTIARHWTTTAAKLGELIPWHTLSTEEQTAFKTRHESRYGAVLSTPKPSAAVATATKLDELIPWHTLSTEEQTKFKTQHEARYSALHNSNLSHLKDQTRRMALDAITDLNANEIELLRAKQIEHRGINNDDDDDASTQQSSLGKCKHNDDVPVDIDLLTAEQMRAILKKKHHHHHQHHPHKKEKSYPEPEITYVHDETLRSTGAPMNISMPLQGGALTTGHYRRTNPLAEIAGATIETVDRLFDPYDYYPPYHHRHHHHRHRHWYYGEETPLVNINHLPGDQQSAILQNMAKLAYSNEKNDTLSEKKLFEALHAPSLMSNATTSSLFLGKPINVETTPVSCPNNVLPPDGICGDKMMTHIQKTYPAFAELLTRVGMKAMFNALLHNHEIVYLIVVPTREMLRAYRGQPNAVIARMLASLMLLLHKGEDVPISERMYSCMTLLDGVRTTVRRKDAKTLEIDNTVEASVDPNSVGRVYSMREQPTIEDLEEEAEEEMAITEAEEAEEVETPEKTSKTVEPTIMETVPENDTEDLALVEVGEEEEEVKASTEAIMQAVHHNFPYKNRHLETLCHKMMSRHYTGIKDMANFVDYGASLNATTAAVTNIDGRLFLKVYHYDDLYKRYQSNTLHPSGKERLSLSAAYEIASHSPMTYNLDKNLTMRECVMPSHLRIKKSDLIHRLCVLSFRGTNTEYNVALFSMPDNAASVESTKTDVYMSPDESVVMRFQNNVLASIALNTNSEKFHTTNVSRRLEHKNTLLAAALRHPMHVSAMNHISAGVRFNKEAFAKLYAKELNFGAFVNAVLPLSVPSFISKIEALGRHLLTKAHDLVAMTKPLDLTRYEHRVKEDRDADILIGIGGGSRDLAKNLHTYYFTRKQWRDKLDKRDIIMQYEYNDDETLRGNPEKGYGAVDFRKLRGAGTSKTLSVTLKNPTTQKSQNFLFRLPNTSKIATTRFYRTREKEPVDKHIHFIFELDGGLLTNIYLTYKLKSLARLGATAATTTTKTTSKVASSRFEDSLISFLADEASAYKRNINPLHTEQRAKAYAIHSEVLAMTKRPGHTYDKSKTHDFLERLATEVKQSIDSSSMASSPLTTSITASESYLSPNESETQRFHALLTSGFKTTKPGAALATLISGNNGVDSKQQYDTASVVKGVIERHGADRDTKSVNFMQYMMRVQLIVNTLVSAFQ